MSKSFKYLSITLGFLFCMALLISTVKAEDEKVTEKGLIKVEMNKDKQVAKAFLVNEDGDVIYQIVIDKKSAAACIKFKGKFVEITGTVKIDDDNDNDWIKIQSIKETKPDTEE